MVLAPIELALDWAILTKADKGMQVVSGRAAGIKSVTYM